MKIGHSDLKMSNRYVKNRLFKYKISEQRLRKGQLTC